MTASVKLDLGSAPRMAVLHFYDAKGHLIESTVVADPARMEVLVPEGAASFVTTWAQDVRGEPVVKFAGMPIQATQIS